jgi:hypothetical protein
MQTILFLSSTFVSLYFWNKKIILFKREMHVFLDSKMEDALLVFLLLRDLSYIIIFIFYFIFFFLKLLLTTTFLHNRKDFPKNLCESDVKKRMRFLISFFFQEAFFIFYKRPLLYYYINLIIILLIVLLLFFLKLLLTTTFLHKRKYLSKTT